MTGYNGYTNYETWNVNLWIDNDYDDQKYWLEKAREAIRIRIGLRANANSFVETYHSTPQQDAIYGLSQDLKDEYEAIRPILNGTFEDLLAAALGAVNWYEIAENLVEQAMEEANA